ncbi:hypothetical protein K491DRAFT_709388 [Lophiostoma macrostomum CBS 122681]|uniref:C3H1-type domain-containing protein n=1 Tax=Lophiostoma macrostomum CBS 122681 TaxID=1314788 RepID=A0A6A6TU67_9PLEO|nr:hypothetical protein K491DRAFT_709388 [Lophiostoma macrostomum CBS 122681]
MTSFKFPPPPPPPPKASTNDAQEQYSSQRGGHNNQGGGRGRGGQGRGRGNNYNGPSRGGYSQGHGDSRSNGSANTRGNQRGGGFQRDGRGASQHTSPRRPQPRAPQTNTPTNRSQNAYVNPQFQHGAPTQLQADPAALAQAMAFMATPAGVQSMAAFANHMSQGGQMPQSPTSSMPGQSPSEFGGKKRKRNENIQPPRPAHASPPLKQQPPSQKPPRAKAAPPPAIPNFGFALPPVKAPQPVPKTTVASKAIQNKPKVHLGLTRQGEVVYEESSGEEDIDEEAAYASKAKFDGMVFEYGGETLSLQTPAELAAFIKDRKRQYPTRRRITEKAREIAERRTAEIDFLRKLSGRPPAPKSANDVDTERKASVSNEAVEALRRRVQESVLEKQRERAQSNVQIAPAPASDRPKTMDLGLGYSSESDSDGEESSELSDSSVLSSSDESSDDSDEESDSDSGPEEVTSRKAPPPAVVPPAPPPAPPRDKTADGREICSFWEQYGKCRLGRRCRFAHPPPVEKRVGLYERLVEQEKEKADRLALDAIKYLGRNGFLG